MKSSINMGFREVEGFQKRKGRAGVVYLPNMLIWLRLLIYSRHIYPDRIQSLG